MHAVIRVVDEFLLDLSAIQVIRAHGLAQAMRPLRGVRRGRVGLSREVAVLRAELSGADVLRSWRRSARRGSQPRPRAAMGRAGTARSVRFTHYT